MTGPNRTARWWGTPVLPATIDDVTSHPVSSHHPLSTGLQMHAVHWGDPDRSDGVPIVLVHGLASNARLWDCAARELRSLGHGVVAVDQRGHGQSGKPDHGYDMDSVTDDLVAMIDVLATDGRWQRPLVIGQSWGGNVVIELAHRHPRAVRGVCAVDGGAIQLSAAFTSWDECSERLAPPRLVGMEAERLRAAISAMHPDWPRESIDGVMHNMEIRADGTVAPWLTFERHMQIVRSLWEHRPSALYADIEVPVMFAPAVSEDGSDAFDRRKRQQLDEALKLIPRCRIEWFVGADHDLHAQQPRRFAEAVHSAIEDGHFPAGVAA